MFVVLLFVCVLINKLHCLKTRCTLEPGIEAYEEADRGIDTRHDADKAMLKAYAWKLLYLYILNIDYRGIALRASLRYVRTYSRCDPVQHGRPFGIYSQQQQAFM